MLTTAKATSVTVEGDDDGWEAPRAFHGEMSLDAGTRLIVSVPAADLGQVHRALIDALAGPLSFLYRQKIDRRAVASGETPATTMPSRDFLALDLDKDEVRDALAACADLVYHDARGEFWIRGGSGEQLVLDADGLVFCYPDDPSFRDVLASHDIEERDVQTVADRDFVKHWFHAEADEAEDRLIGGLRLLEVPNRGT